MKLPIDSKYFGNLSLKGMVEIVSPDKISWYPQTYGWKILLYALLLFLIYKTYGYIVIWWKNRYLRSLIKEVSTSNKSLEELATISIICSGKYHRNFDFLDEKSIHGSNRDLLNDYLYKDLERNKDFHREFKLNLISYLRSLLWLS